MFRKHTNIIHQESIYRKLGEMSYKEGTEEGDYEGADVTEEHYYYNLKIMWRCSGGSLCSPMQVMVNSIKNWYNLLNKA